MPIIGSKPKQANSNSIVYVSSLKFSVNEQDLLELFKNKNFDPIRARLLYDQEGNSKGTGFVEMKSLQEAEDAVNALSGELFMGRNLIVSLAT